MVRWWCQGGVVVMVGSWQYGQCHCSMDSNCHRYEGGACYQYDKD